MSEGKKVILVATSLEHEVLVEQLNSLGIDVEVQVDPKRVSEIVQGLLSLPTARERMERALSQGAHSEGNPVIMQVGGPSTETTREDSKSPTIEELGRRQLEREASQNPVVPLLTEILGELKGIKEAVKGPELKISMEGSNVGRLGDWYDTVFEKKVPATKEEFIDLMTELLLNKDNLPWFPMITLVKMPVHERQEVLKLLKPQFEAVFAGHYNDHVEHGPFKPEQIFESFIEALHSGRTNLNFYGLNTLPEKDKIAVKALCERALGKKEEPRYSMVDFAETSGHLPTAILNQLAHEFQTDVKELHLKGLDSLSERNRGELYGRLKSASIHNEMFVGGSHTEKSFIEKLLEALSNSDTNAITLADLKRLDLVTRRNLRNALKASLIQLADLEQARENFIVHGQRHAPADVGKEGVKNIAFILGEFAREWADAAEKRGVHVDLMRLVEHLLEDALRQTQGSANELRSEGIQMDGGIKLGEHAMTLQPNGNMLIVTRSVGRGNVFHYLDIHGECVPLTFGLQPPVGK